MCQGGGFAYTPVSSMRAPIFYDYDNTAYYLDPSSTGTSMNAAGNITIGNGGNNTGLFINYGGGAGDYAVVGRCYQSGTNNQTIHVFSTNWQSGTLQSTSAGSINLDGANGTTIGAWNNNDMWIDKSGNSQSRSSSRAPIFYDSNNTAYYLDPASTGKALLVNGNIECTARSESWAEGLRINVPSASTWGGIRWTRGSSTGNWALGYTALDSTDDLVFYSGTTNTVRARLDHSANFTASGNITAYSDERLKTNWRDMPEDYVTRLAQVKVGIYDRINENDMTQVGVSAQSLQELLPQAILTAQDEMQTLSVNYGGAALASAVELAKYVTALEQRISQLEARL